MQLLFLTVFLSLSAVGFVCILVVPPYAFGPLMLLYLPAMFVVLCFVSARLMGWRDLAVLYRTTRRFEGKTLWRSGLNMRWYLGYRSGWVGIGTNVRGFYLATSFVLRAGHPPLFVPWTDVVVEERAVLPLTLFSWRGQRCMLHFRKIPSVTLAIYINVVDDLKAEAGPAWPAPIQRTTED